MSSRNSFQTVIPSFRFNSWECFSFDDSTCLRVWISSSVFHKQKEKSNQKRKNGKSDLLLPTRVSTPVEAVPSSLGPCWTSHSCGRRPTCCNTCLKWCPVIVTNEWMNHSLNYRSFLNIFLNTFCTTVSQNRFWWHSPEPAELCSRTGQCQCPRTPL